MISRTGYSVISVTTPAPTARPPSRIANRSSFSIATGWISSIAIVTLSPGITISTPPPPPHPPPPPPPPPPNPHPYPPHNTPHAPPPSPPPPSTSAPTPPLCCI